MFSKIYNMSMNRKSVFLLSALVFQVCVVLIGVYELSKIQTFTYLEREHAVTINSATQKIEKVTSLANYQTQNIKTHLLESSATQAGIQDLISKAKTIVEICIDRLNPAELALFELVGFGEVIKLCRQDIKDADASLAIIEKIKMAKSDVIAPAMLQDLASIIDNMAEGSKKFSILMPQVSAFVKSIVYWLIPLISILTALILYFVLLDTRKKLNILSEKMNHIRMTNDLSVRVKISHKDEDDSDDEVLHVCRDFNIMMEQFENVVQNIAKMSAVLSTTSQPLINESRSSQKKMMEQNQSADTIVTSMEDFVRAINEIAQNTNTTSESANNSYRHSQHGREIVNSAKTSASNLFESSKNMQQSVEALNNNSQSIVSIIDVITDISEQTNLLALNAAIEAARAGEQGRGFAVVADEVRALASRTQQSTDSIRSMIDQLHQDTDSMNNLIVSNGELVTLLFSEMEKTDNTLADIAGSTEQIKDMNLQIATATEEQLYVVNEIQAGVKHMKGLSNETADAVTNMLNSVHDVSNVIDEMNTTVAQFKVSKIN
ncbi:methyl-accepting chemotaxis protein [Marinomonas agarivorans]|nr:methyl-accepting chemotaxis protein [Marinomonas agarivorans]